MQPGIANERAIARERLGDLVEDYGGNSWHGSTGSGNGVAEEAVLFERVDGGARWLLVEENARGGFWLTAHDSPAAAGTYHAGQEYREDWTVVELVDLVTGDSYQATITVTWAAAGRIE